MPVKLRRLRALLRKGRKPIALAALAVLAMAVLMIRGLNVRLRPVLEAAASSRAAGLMTQAINAAVDDCLQENKMSYADFVTLETDTAGRVTSITSNTAANSRFRRLVTESIAQRLSALDRGELGVPLGTLTGEPLLLGAGPAVRVRVDSVGDVAADYVNSFISAGVNQTLHRISLDITATIHLFLPGGVLPVSVSSSVCVAETVIVGETPDTYLNLEKGTG